MSDALKIRRALLSVYDKTGIVDFARALHEEFGIELISTGGTARVLKDADLPVTLVEEITGFPELMDGRVKTLHPRIHAAILADRDNPEHLRQLAEQGIEPIDMVVVNLYPLEKTIAKPDCTFEEAIEMIDIGGPCLLRAAAKNHKHVLVCTLSRQLDEVLKLLRSGDQSAWDRVRSEFARQVFWSTGTYDGEIESWLSRRCPNGDLGDRLLRLLNGRGLRYGENPHQEADYFMLCDDPRCDAVASQVGQAQAEISFNNYVDASAALELCAELTSVWHRLPAGGPMWHRLPAGGGTGRMPVPRKKMWQPIGEELQTRGNLPHIQKPGKTYFVTFRLRQGELPPTARDIALDACRFWQGKKMNLHIAAVMPNHVHMLLTPFEIESGEAVPLGELLHSIKSFSSNEINKLLGRSGSLWLDENWDRIMRSQKEFVETWEYIETNAERAGLGEAYRWIWKGTTGFEETGLVRRQDAGLTASAHRLEAGATQEGGPPDHRLEAGATQEGGPPDHRLEAGATQEEGPPDHRLEAGATQEEGPPDHRLEAGATLTCCFIKHTNACGVAVGENSIDVYQKAYLGDPNAAMGGILAVNFDVDATFAEAVMETYQRWGKDAGAGGFFVEVWLAPSFDEDAVQVIRTRKKWGERVRLLDVGDMVIEPDPSELNDSAESDAGSAGVRPRGLKPAALPCYTSAHGHLDFKRIAGGVLMQNRDLLGLNEEQWQVVSARKPTEAELDDLRLAWLICKHTKSNAITVCKDGMLLGNGAGQMSRVMSCRIAAWLATENGHADQLKGAAAASDAFFPFRDGPDILAEAGVTALIQPGGSKRDQEVIAACDERDVAMIFTGTRHFKH